MPAKCWPFCPGLFVLTHWGRDKIAAVSQTTLSNAFSWMKMLEFWLRFQWSWFLRVLLTIFQHWFWQWLGADQATSHYLNQCWLDHWRIYASLGLNELKQTVVPFCVDDQSQFSGNRADIERYLYPVVAYLMQLPKPLIIQQIMWNNQVTLFNCDG